MIFLPLLLPSTATSTRFVKATRARLPAFLVPEIATLALARTVPLVIICSPPKHRSGAVRCRQPAAAFLWRLDCHLSARAKLWSFGGLFVFLLRRSNDMSASVVKACCDGWQRAKDPKNQTDSSVATCCPS